MAKSSKKNSAGDVLRYTRKGSSRATVWRHYLRWRQQQNPPLPLRCDNPDCFFHKKPLIWNGKPFKPILDHIDGNNTDNRPDMLRLLCPNCDSQQPTRGGANKGRIEKSEGGFAKVSRDGKRDYILLADAGIFSVGTATADSTTSDSSVDNSAKAEQSRNNNQFDIRDLNFDNKVIVAGGVIATDGLLWIVPDGICASHVIGDKHVSMTLVCVNGVSDCVSR
jgi:hypothetical protein